MRASKAVVELKKLIAKNEVAACVQIFASADCPSFNADEINALFHAAVIRRSKDLCQLFLGEGADINCLVRGRSALQEAVESRSLELTRFLLKRGAQPNTKGDNGQTALHRAQSDYSILEPIAKEEKLCTLLLKHGANPNAVCNDYRTPLHLAVLESNVRTARILVANGADPSFIPEERDQGYLTPFQMAVDQGNPRMALFFLHECSVNVNEKTLMGRSLLQLTRNPLILQEVRAIQSSLAVEKALGSQDDSGTPPRRRTEGPML